MIKISAVLPSSPLIPLRCPLFSLALHLCISAVSFASEEVPLARGKKKTCREVGGVGISSWPGAALHCRSHEGKKQMFEQTFLTAVPRGPAGAPDWARLFRSNDSHNLLNPCGTFQKYFALKNFISVPVWGLLGAPVTFSLAIAANSHSKKLSQREGGFIRSKKKKKYNCREKWTVTGDSKVRCAEFGSLLWYESTV